jgi:ABC-type transporter Mla maintaining outer membrane lipid asymmetry ATPase subunit MlaF
VTSAELDALIVQLNKSLGTTMVVVSHELSSIFAIADRASCSMEKRKVSSPRKRIKTQKTELGNNENKNLDPDHVKPI